MCGETVVAISPNRESKGARANPITTALRLRVGHVKADPVPRRDSLLSGGSWQLFEDIVTSSLIRLITLAVVDV
jgi:hypothetical protein